MGIAAKNKTIVGDIPEEIIEQAVFHWVKISDQASSQQVSLCRQWRQQSELHEQAWLRIQSLDQDFITVPEEHKSLAVRSNSQLELSRRSALKLFALTGLMIGSTSMLWQQGWLSGESVLVTRRGQINQHSLSDDVQLSLNSQTEVDINFSAQARVLST